MKSIIALGSFLSTILLVELLGHGFVVYRYGHPLWSTDWPNEIFSIGKFLQIVDDERVIVPKPGYEDHFVRIDEFGFKRGGNVVSREGTNIIFIGDSVPFGYGVEDSQSPPSFFYEYLQVSELSDFGVINAAVPSYTLHQSVLHYEKAVHGKFSAHAVILQTYDPVNQFIRHGKYWNNRINWANSREKINPYAVRIRTSPYLKNSAILFLALPVALKAELPETTVSPRDADLLRMFQNDVYSDLIRIHELIQKDGGTLVILPVNPAKQMRKNTMDILSVVVYAYNVTLKRFAQDHTGVLYVDIQTYFDSIGRDGLFRDACCHLTEKGAQTQAKFIFDELMSIGIFN